MMGCDDDGDDRFKKLRLEMAETVFTPSLEGMKNVKSEQGQMLTKPFLDVCKLILPVIGKLHFVFVYLNLYLLIFTMSYAMLKITRFEPLCYVTL